MCTRAAERLRPMALLLLSPPWWLIVGTKMYQASKSFKLSKRCWVRLVSNEHNFGKSRNAISTRPLLTKFELNDFEAPFRSWDIWSPEPNHFVCSLSRTGCRAMAQVLVQATPRNLDGCHSLDYGQTVSQLMPVLSRRLADML